MIKFYPSGLREHYNINGKIHKEDGPASIYYEDDFWYKTWYINGAIHRIDGPAIENSRGHKEYWYYGNRIDVGSTEDFIRYIKLLAFI